MPSKAYLILRSAREGASRSTHDANAALPLMISPISQRSEPRERDYSLRRRFENGCRHRGGFERRVDDLLDPLGPDEAQPAARRLRDVLVILAVAFRQDHHLEPGARRGNDLFLDAADRQYQASEADLA